MGQFQVGKWKWDCSFCNIFGAQKWILRLYIFLLFVTGSAQQVVLLSPFNRSSVECVDGSVIVGTDQVVMTGSVDTTAPYPIAIEFQKRRVGGSFTTDCPFVITSNGSCVSPSIASCYCQSFSGTTYSVVYNRTADERDSSASLVLLYNGSPSATQSMPLVRNVEQVDVTVSRARSSLLNVCDQNFLSGRMYDFEICARNLENVEFFIGMDASVGPWLSAINNCSSFSNVTLPHTGSLTFAYRETTGCQRENRLNCTISGPVSDPCSTGCIIGIVVGCVVVVVVIIVVIVVCVKKKSRGTIPPQKIPNLEHGGGHHHDEDRNTTTNSQNQENGNSHAAVVVIESVTIIISVDASREVLEQKVKDKVPEDKKRTLTKPLEFKYKGTTMGRENWRLKEHFPQYRGDLVLIAIVHLDESHLCEIKEVKEKASSGGTSSGGNNAVRDSRM